MAKDVRPNIANIVNSADQAGLGLPQAFTERFTEIGKQAAGVQIVSDDIALLEAIIAAQGNGKDPLAAATVTRLAIAGAITSRDLRASSAEWASNQYRELLDTHADEIFATISKASKAVGKSLADAHQVLGDMSLEDSSAAIIKGDKYVKAWRTANDGIARWDYLERTWTQLATALRMRLPMGRGALLRSPDYSIKNRHKVPEAASAWSLVADYSLSLALPTRSEWRDRFKGLDSDIRANNAKVEVQEIKSFFAGTRLPVLD